MLLVVKNNTLFAVDANQEPIGKVINCTDGGCFDNPPIEEADFFFKIFSGHGYIYHQHDNPPNPFFNKSWGEVFENPELLPVGTKNIFIDQSGNIPDYPRLTIAQKNIVKDRAIPVSS